MYNVGDYVIYLKDVCLVETIKEKYMNDTDYYILVPINDKSLKLSIPVNNPSIRSLLSKEEVEKMIDDISNIEVITDNDRMIEGEYKRLLAEGSHEDLLKVIKTTYLRNKTRLDNKKKISDKDKNYMEMAEKYLLGEFSIVLDMSYDEALEYVISKVQEGLEHA